MKNAVSYYQAKFSKISYCIFFIAFFSAHVSFSQTRGKVQVIKDPRIDTLAARRLEPVKSEGNARMELRPSSGYRVQIFTGSNRKEAYDAQARFQEAYPDIRTYITYREPNFKVRAGDFRSKMEAEKLLEELKRWFNGMFIIFEKINPKVDSTND